MTFEQQLKTILKTDIETVTGYVVHVYNDVTVDFTKRIPSEEEINLIIYTGSGNKSKIQNLEMTSYPISIQIVVNQNALQDILSKLKDYTDSINGQVFQAEGSSTYFNLGFDEVSVISRNQIIQADNDEVTVAICSLMGTCIQSDQDISLPSFKLSFDGTTYLDIDWIYNYNDGYTASYSQVQEEGFAKDDMSYDGATRQWQIVLYKKKSSAFQIALDQYIDNFNSSKVILKKDAKNYSCVIQSVSEQLGQQVGIPLITIVFTEVRGE